MRWPASTPSPRAIGAISLAVLGACGAALVLTAPPANQARAAASLLSRSNWVLATALPASQDVPADWGYSLTGRLRRAVSPSTVPPAALPNTSRAAVYSPAGCGNIPKILDHSSADLAAYVQIDRDVQVFGQDAPLDAAALCVLATAAVLITAPAVHSALRSGASGRQPLAPRLAALSDQELAQLLPKQSEFPASWTVDETTELSDTFGYFKYHVFDEGLGFDPIECFGVVGVASTGAFDAAQVFGHDPAAQVAVADGKDILLTVGREFDRSGFDAFVGLVSRCLRFGSAVAGSYTVRILEDSRPTAGPQRFRYSLTTTISAEPADETRTDYYSYGRTSGLILTGSAGSGHQQALDALFDITLQRIVER